MRVLILGAGGYLGSVLFSCCNAKTEYSIYGTYLTRTREGMHFLDIFDIINMQEVINSINPDIVVWCIMNEQRELELSDKALRHLLSFLKPTVRFVYLSTCLSSKENHNEEMPPEPREEGMYYANYVNGKILGEQLVKTHDNHVIIRPGQIYGFGASGELDIRMLRVQSAIKNDGKMIRSANAYISTIHVEDLSDCIIELFDSDFTGTLCIASNKIISYYSFYKFLARLIGVEEEKIVPDYESKFPSGYFDTSKVQSIISTPIRAIG